MVDFLQQARDALGDSLERDWLPDEPNATRVRYSGGSENPTGEQDGETRQERRLRVTRDGEARELDQTAGGDREDRREEALRLSEDALEVGDRLEFDDDPGLWRVREIEPVRAGSVFSWKATIEEVESGEF